MDAAKGHKRKKCRYAKTPTVFQMEATECGAASLTMILGYFGKFMPLEQMRVETGVSRDGCNARNIMRAARKFGLEVHGYRKSTEGLMELPVPCILHWNFNHFVVWEGVKGKDCYINDPAMGRRKLTYDDIDSCFTGVVLTFATTEDFTKNRKEDKLIGMVAERLKGEKASLTALVVTGLFLILPGMLIPVYSQVFIDDILIGGNRDWITALLVIMAVTILYLEKKLENKYTIDQILPTLQEMDFMKYEGKGYQPVYTRTAMTDAIHEAFGFCTSKEIVPVAKMRNIISQTKK